MKKFLKRSLSILLAITIIFSSAYAELSEVDFGKLDLGGLLAVKVKAATIVESGVCGKNLTWTLDDAGTLTISGTGEMYNYSSSSSVPWYSSRANVKTVVIDNGVTSIGGSAFSGCTSLTSATIGNGVTSIGSYAFCNCTSLTSIAIPDSVTSIGERAFSDCTSLRSITIPDGVTSIGRYAFSNCTSLTSLTIGNGVTSIGHCAFSDCTSLKSVTLGNGETSIGSYAFNGCTSLTNVYITDLAAWCGIDFGGYYSNPLEFAKNLYINGELATDVVIPDGVTTIPVYAFACENIISVTIPDSVTSIGGYAFYGCDNLTSVTIGNSVTSIGDWAFRDCTNLISITIPDSVTSIGEYAFNSCDSLTNVYITDLAAWCGVDFYNSDSNPLYSADKLYINGELPTDIVIPDGVTTIPVYAFACENIISVTIPDSVTSIGDDAFHSCGNLTSITIPDSVTSIGDDAFKYCASLVAINVSADNTAYSSVDGVLFNNNKTTLIQYPDGKTDEAYKIPDSVKSFDSSAFYGADFKTIVLGKGHTNVASRLFESRTSLENVVIPANITSISSDAFSGCHNIKNVFYGGTQDEWASMVIASGNTDLTNTRIHYNVDVDDWENHCTKPVVTKEPTCTSTGTQTYTCPCGYEVTETLPSYGHSYPDEWQTQAPTCETQGYDYRKCTVCGYQYTTNWVSSLGHSWSSEWTVDREPTCTENGYKTRHCTVCDEYTDYVTIYATGHTCSDEWVIDWNATCTEEGRRHKKCLTCNEDVSYEYIPVLGHSCSDEWTIEWNATCTNKGRKYKECLTCHEPMSYEYIPTVPHKSSGWIVDRNPTCTRAGLKHTECDWCGEVFAEERISALGHTASDWIVDRNPTYTATGSKHNECIVCGATVETAVIPQLKPATPTLSSVANTPTGVKFVWGKVTGADSYVVYRRTYNASTKTWSGWQNIAKSITTNSYVDKNVTSGTYYIYTVRANNEAGLSGFNATGLKTYFLSTPTLASVTNSSTGVTVKWGKVTGATNYVVYRRAYNATTKKWSGWTNLGKTTATSFADKTAKSGNYYIYTVKALAGTYTSAYNTTGLKTYFLSAPALSSVTSTTSGVKFIWGKVTGASGYIVYRKTYNATTKTWGGWTNLGKTTSASFVDKSAKKGTYYAYTTKAYYGSYTSYYNTTGLKVKVVY